MRLGGRVHADPIASRTDGGARARVSGASISSHRHLARRCGCDIPRHRTPWPGQSRSRLRACAATTLPARRPSAVTRPMPVMATRGLTVAPAPRRQRSRTPAHPSRRSSTSRARVPSAVRAACLSMRWPAAGTETAATRRRSRDRPRDASRCDRAARDPPGWRDSRAITP